MPNESASHRGEGAQALAANKVRTFFMMAGTIVGIAALTVIMAIGKGTEQKVKNRVETWGPRAMMLIAGGGKDLPPPDMNVTTLRLEDAEAIRNEIDGLESSRPRHGVQHGPQAWHEPDSGGGVGVEPNWHDAWKWYAVEGDGITSDDVPRWPAFVSSAVP